MNIDLFLTKQLWVNVRVNKSLAGGKNGGSMKGNIRLVLYIIILMR